MKYLLRDEQNGFVEKTTPPDLFDSRGSARYRPWALTSDGRVVYAEWKRQGDGLQGIFDLAFSGMQRKTALKAYDKSVSQLRRREFETKLAQDAAKHPECYRSAVDEVTLNLRAFVGKEDAKAGTHIKSRCFSDTGSGTLGSKLAGETMAPELAWQIALRTLEGADIPKILGIQQTLATVLTRNDLKLTGGLLKRFDDTKTKVAPSQGHLYTWFDKTQGTPTDNQLRGRQKRLAQGQVTKPTSAPGLMESGQSDESRVRGIDEWTRDGTSKFVKAIDTRNLIFGAGRSGTTGELLKTYRTFGGLDDGEEFKKYLLAIVVYLVGGGHHTCHEIFSVANLLVGSNGPRAGRDYASVSTLVKQAYVPGKYLKHLPDAYLGTDHFQALQERYYDIAMMGHLHGTFV